MSPMTTIGSLFTGCFPRVSGDEPQEGRLRMPNVMVFPA